MKSLQIKNYKNLNDFKIDSLSRVNLIVGNNNVGKSTLLEAISIFVTKGDINQLKNILNIRGEGVDFSRYVENRQEKEIERFISLYKDRDFNAFFLKPIEITTNIHHDFVEDSSKVSIRLVRLIEKMEEDENGIENRNTKIVDNDDHSEYVDSNIAYGILSTLDGKSSLYTFGRRTLRPTNEKTLPFEYIRTSQITNDKNPQLFDKIALTPLEKEIINALRIIEPRIDAINFLKDESHQSSLSVDNRVPIVIFSMSTERYKLSSMGDGINRILTIILALLNCKNGILLIDEFENGLHHTVQTQLWEMVYLLADKLNVQVFATTHSDDCIKSFVAADTNQMGKLIRLENRDGTIDVVPFNDIERLRFAMNEHIEVR